MLCNLPGLTTSYSMRMNKVLFALWSLSNHTEQKNEVHLFPSIWSTLSLFALQFWDLGNLKLWFYNPPPHLTVSSKQLHTHIHAHIYITQRETTGCSRTLHLQLEQTQFTRQDFLQILQLNFSLPRGEDASPFLAQYPRANAGVSCLCLPIHYDYEYFKGRHGVCFLVSPVTLRRNQCSEYTKALYI